MNVAFCGLGAMGRPMAANLARRFPTRVWNRTTARAEEHAQQHGTRAAVDLAELADVEVVCTCLPTTTEVAGLADDLAPLLGDGALWLDHTSGDPGGSREVARHLAAHGVHYLDAPVSGGTDGAAAGTLTIMVGGDPDVLRRAQPVLEAMGRHVIHVGEVGAGMAVKAVNNALLAASLWAAAEGLTSLARNGVDPTAALQVINGSSGRSFATERLLPERWLTRDFPRTFALSLLAKDVDIARDLVAGANADAEVLPLAAALTRAAAERLGPLADHVELVRVVEAAADVEVAGAGG